MASNKRLCAPVSAVGAPDASNVSWDTLPEDIGSVIASHVFFAWMQEGHFTAEGHFCGNRGEEGRALSRLNRAFFKAFRPMRILMRHDHKHPLHAFCLVEGTLRYLQEHKMTTHVFSHLYTQVFMTASHCKHRLNLVLAITYWLVYLHASGEFAKPSHAERARQIHTFDAIFRSVDRFVVPIWGFPTVARMLVDAYSAIDVLCV